MKRSPCDVGGWSEPLIVVWERDRFLRFHRLCRVDPSLPTLKIRDGSGKECTFRWVGDAVLEEYLRAYLEGEQDRCANEADVKKWSVREQDSNYVFTVTNTLQEEHIQPGSVLLCMFVKRGIMTRGYTSIVS